MKYIFAFTALILIGCAANRIQPDPIYKETEVRNLRPKLNAEIFDENERNETMRFQFSEADRIAERKVGNAERNGQFIFVFWQEKKLILSKNFGIRWQTPAELNPGICYLNYGQPCITAEENKELMSLVYHQTKSANQTVQGIHRDFHGYVYLGACNSEKTECGQYKYYGHDREWKYLGYSIIEE